MFETSKEINEIDVALVCNPGGHLQSMRFLRDAYADYEYAFLTHKSVTTSDLYQAMYFPKIDHKYRFGLTALLQYLIVFLQTIYIIIQYSPSVFISTGGYLAAPTLIAAKLLGKHVIFVENISRKTSKSLSGRIIYVFADRFFVQHEELCELYGQKAEYMGPII
ncbi:glycosyltransferase [Halorubrum ezzemoulense]|uniref:PssD/Cps14F family polysaccharide biosynthesis glycosyltransferase n=1 Tax=Halorubrum ezzemoulense TaxID=337243 RepID=UPI002330C102|nr:PssD/Cps14F family polysaccharide biosynthesis glycosyltransferase [Halorubrum ezzemoulense]MDB9281711.1 glycosyltransferase [Halorubrum ezzemoulense]MDB9285204.1 glycosyltransferase [Halorubrum ezzemoulense]